VALTYHATPRTYFDSLDAGEPYRPAEFGSDGFIHCTDGPDRLVDVLNEFYADRSGDWIALVIDTDHLTSPVQYEDPNRVFPHVYGPINRDAIVDVRPIARDAGGRFAAVA